MLVVAYCKIIVICLNNLSTVLGQLNQLDFVKQKEGWHWGRFRSQG